MVRLGRLWVIGCWLLGCAMAAAQSAPPPSRILFVGNSYFYYNNSLHNHVKALLQAADPAAEKRLQVKSATIGGASLDHHNLDWLTTPGRIGVAQPFEVVILAGNSTDAFKASTRDKFETTVRQHDQVIRSRGGQTWLYMTPAHVAPHPQAAPDAQARIAAMYEGIGRELRARVLPVGWAFDESLRRHPQLRLHDEQDHSHPNLLGTYLAACVVYAELFGRSPVGNAYDAQGRIPAEVRGQLQSVAADVVQRSRAKQPG